MRVKGEREPVPLWPGSAPRGSYIEFLPEGASKLLNPERKKGGGISSRKRTTMRGSVERETETYGSVRSAFEEGRKREARGRCVRSAGEGGRISTRGLRGYSVGSHKPVAGGLVSERGPEGGLRGGLGRVPMKRGHGANFR